MKTSSGARPHEIKANAYRARPAYMSNWSDHGRRFAQWYLRLVRAWYRWRRQSRQINSLDWPGAYVRTPIAHGKHGRRRSAAVRRANLRRAKRRIRTLRRRGLM